MKIKKIPSFIYNQISSIHQFFASIYNLIFSQDQSLVDQFFITLNSTYSKIDKDSQYVKQFPDIVNEVEGLLKGVRSWRKAYNIEQLLIALISDEQLEVEWQRRLAEAKTVLGSDLNEYYKNHGTLAKRESLTRLVIDLQWHYENKQTLSHYKRAAKRNTGLIFIFAFLMFFFSGYLENLVQYFGLQKLSLNQGTKNYHIFTAVTAGARKGKINHLFIQMIKYQWCNDLSITT